jgi:acyl-CoA synthetase (AMP-forming)/AMP-acid ligase II
MSVIQSAPPWRRQLDSALSLAKAEAGMTDANLPAVQDDENQLSLPALQSAASWVARKIWDAGRPGNESSSHVVALFVEKSCLCVVASLGALLAGTRFVDLPATSKDAEIVRILRVVKPTIVVTTSSLRERLPEELLGGAAVIAIDDAVTVGGTAPPIPFLPDADGNEEGARATDDGGFCVLTSGTTSVSKIVVCRHEALTCATSYFAEDLRPGDKARRLPPSNAEVCSGRGRGRRGSRGPSGGRGPGPRHPSRPARSTAISWAGGPLLGLLLHALRHRARRGGARAARLDLLQPRRPG